MPPVAGGAVFVVTSGTLVVYAHNAILLIASSAVTKVAGPRFMPWALLSPWRRIVGIHCSCSWLWWFLWYQLRTRHADELDLLAVQGRPRVALRWLRHLQVRATDMRAPVAVLGIGIPSSSWDMKESSKFRVTVALARSGIRR